MAMIVRLIGIYREAAPILIIAYHPLSGCKISYDYRCADLGVLIADPSTIKSGKARARVLFWKYP